MTEAFSDFPQSLKALAGIVPQIGRQQLPSTRFPISNSRIFLSLDATGLRDRRCEIR
jgi:hypothetical protein